MRRNKRNATQAGAEIRAAPTLDDHALLRRVSEKETQAFEQLYRRYYPRLYHFLLRMVKRPDIVEEVINDTMFIVWRKAETFAGRSSVSTWVTGIAYRRALKALKRLGGRQIWVDLDAQPLADPRPADQVVEALLLGRQIKRALAALSPEHRAVIELTFFHGYRYKDIAELAGCPVGTVKTRMFHARAKLRELLGDLSQ